VDVRDLAAWLVEAAQHRWSGRVNATGATGMTTYGELLAICARVVAGSGSSAAVEWVPVSEADLLAAGVEPWWHLPFWIPAATARTFWQVETGTACRLGLASRPVQDTVADTWAWVNATGQRPDDDGGYGMPRELEQRFL
jgi:nucleoside-diphosphate-sugar epimerase